MLCPLLLPYSLSIFLCHPAPPLPPFPPRMQIVRLVQSWDRPEVPPLEALPGGAAAAFEGLDAYLDLMR